MKEFIEQFKKGGIAVHCDTEDKAKALLRQLDAVGVTWSSGACLTDFTAYEIYKELTCYMVDKAGLGYCTLSYFEDKEIPVIPFDFISHEDPQKATENLFKSLKLEGAYLEAFEEAKKNLGLNDQEADFLENIAGLVQLIVKAETLPYILEIESLKHDNERLEGLYSSLKKENKKLIVENQNLLDVLKTYRKLSMINDNMDGIGLNK